jgi:alkylhydroperoxidase family enzyme
MARPGTRYDSLVERLREAAQPDREAPPGLAPYLEKVRENAYRVTDEDVRALKEAGFSEDVIFEQTVSVAAAAGLERLEAALAVLP